ncbi:MAG TPA: ABC transporter permease, partial [Clostridia bacterium]
MVRQRPEIADVEASSSVVARIEKKPNEWMPLLLFVIKDFNTMRINTFKSESGAWPPPNGTILLEKEVLPLVGGKVGDTHKVQTPNGLAHSITISGFVHDPGLAPAWQEQTAYGYITPSTLAMLGENNDLHLLKIIVRDQPFNKESIEKTAGTLATWLNQQGYAVDNIRIPPPGKHPHQSQMNSILLMLLIFSFLALILSGILTSTLIGGLLAQQVRQIGIMKSLGARSWQIASAYIIMIILMCIIAIILGLPSGIAAGRSFVQAVAQLLNLKVYNYSVPGWVFLVLLLSGIITPFLVSY